MRLVSAKVGPYKSIDAPGPPVELEEGVSVLVGMNESGKTVFLEALHKSDDVLGLAKFNHIDDYPRKNLNAYERRHETNPATVTELTYVLSDDEVAKVNDELHTELPNGFQFSISHQYNNRRSIIITVDEKSVLAELATRADLSTEFRDALKLAHLLRQVPKIAEGLSLTDADKGCLASISERIGKAENPKWLSVVSLEVWQWLSSRTPRYLYFGDYEVLPSKMNLTDLANRVAQAASNPSILNAEHRGILALLRMANISIGAFANPGVLEALISRIEAVSINLTDQIMAFWKQNEDLAVKIDIRPDPNDEAPFNAGPNLYIRIANNRHRGVTTPFKQRSRGFIWFFSFLVWFDSVQHQLAEAKDEERPLILLLDEPGLSLHALAQKDFLRYIDDLAEKHQVIYSTHSPFMIHSDRLHEVRLVEDRNKVGTVISDNISWTDERTIFPLQAALGWTIAQNLFISERNLLVEGSAELVYLQAVSSILESQDRTGLRSDVTIVPAGGLDKVATFVALLGANKLKLAVFHDYRGAPEQKLLDLMREKMIAHKAVLNASQFRDLANLGVSGTPSDTEDLFEAGVYLHYFNKAYTKQLAEGSVKVADLPPGDRIVERLERHIAKSGIQLRPSGGFNHYLPATLFARDPSIVDDETLKRFEALFKAVNALF